MGRTGICGLCEERRSLRLSHVIPAFLIRWRKRTGARRFRMMASSEDGIGRLLANVLKRPQQDGPKEYLLCGDCELLIGLDEGRFANKAFEQLSASPQTPLTYGSWLYRFSASLVLRGVLYSRHHDQRLDEWSDAVAAWRRLIMHNRGDCADFEIHLLPIPEGDMQGEVPKDLPPDWEDLIRNDLLMTFGNAGDVPIGIIKVGNLIFVAYGAAPPIPNDWIDYQVWQRGGCIGGCQVKIPEPIYSLLKESWERNPRPPRKM